MMKGFSFLLFSLLIFSSLFFSPKVTYHQSFMNDPFLPYEILGEREENVKLSNLLMENASLLDTKNMDFKPQNYMIFEHDWVIDNTTNIINQTVILNGNLNITASGELYLLNSTLLFNSSFPLNVFFDDLESIPIYHLYIKGGSLIVENSSISLLNPYLFESYLENFIFSNYFILNNQDRLGSQPWHLPYIHV